MNVKLHSYNIFKVSVEHFFGRVKFKRIGVLKDRILLYKELWLEGQMWPFFRRNVRFLLSIKITSTKYLVQLFYCTIF